MPISSPNTIAHLVTPRLPSGAFWICNLILELDLKGYLNSKNFWFDDEFGNSHLKEDVFHRRSMPALYYRQTFRFRDSLDIQWSHEWPSKEMLPHKTIFFVRHVRDAVRSWAKRYQIDGTYKEFIGGVIDTMRWSRLSNPLLHLLPLPDTWALHALTWKRLMGKQLCLLHFEHMKSDPMGDMQKLIAFLGVERTDAEIEKAIANSTIAEAQKVEHAYLEQFPDPTGRLVNRKGKANEGGEDPELNDGSLFAGLPNLALKELGYPGYDDSGFEPDPEHPDLNARGAELFTQGLCACVAHDSIAARTAFAAAARTLAPKSPAAFQVGKALACCIFVEELVGVRQVVDSFAGQLLEVFVDLSRHMTRQPLIEYLAAQGLLRSGERQNGYHLLRSNYTGIPEDSLDVLTWSPEPYHESAVISYDTREYKDESTLQKLKLMRLNGKLNPPGFSMEKTLVNGWLNKTLSDPNAQLLPPGSDDDPYQPDRLPRQIRTGLRRQAYAAMQAEGHKRIALFGIDEHTEKVLAEIANVKGLEAVCLLDESYFRPKEKLGLPVNAPRDLTLDDVDAVLLSNDKLERLHWLNTRSVREKGIPVFGIYWSHSQKEEIEQTLLPSILEQTNDALLESLFETSPELEPIRLGLSIENAKKYFDYCRRKIHGRIFDSLAPHMSPGATILDLGSGSGYNTSQIAKRFPDAKVTGLERAQLGVEMSRRHETANLSFLHSDAMFMPFEDDQFDAVVSLFTIEYVSSPKQMLAEVRRVLKPGGVFLMVTKSEQYLNDWGEAPDNPELAPELPALLANSGMAPVNTDFHGFIFPEDRLESLQVFGFDKLLKFQSLAEWAYRGVGRQDRLFAKSSLLRKGDSAAEAGDSSCPLARLKSSAHKIAAGPVYRVIEPKIRALFDGWELMS